MSQPPATTARFTTMNGLALLSDLESWLRSLSTREAKQETQNLLSIGLAAECSLTGNRTMVWKGSVLSRAQMLSVLVGLMRRSQGRTTRARIGGERTAETTATTT